jgi:hypothetical protein
MPLKVNISFIGPRANRTLQVLGLIFYFFQRHTVISLTFFFWPLWKNQKLVIIGRFDSFYMLQQQGVSPVALYAKRVDDSQPFHALGAYFFGKTVIPIDL